MPDFQPAPGTLPPGQRVYAIGDVHGCDDQLASLHAMIAADLAARPVVAPLLLHLGDYVDRGPDSADPATATAATTAAASAAATQRRDRRVGGVGVRSATEIVRAGSPAARCRSATNSCSA